MKVYESIRLVATRMAQAGIGKGRKNTQQGYNFRGIDDVLNTLSAALSEAGLVILPRVVERTCVERQTAKGGALFYVTVQVEFDLVATDGSKHTVSTYGEAMDSADKATNKALSAAYKYMALLAFCIPVEGNPDADYTTHEVAHTDRRPDLLAAIEQAADLDALADAYAAGAALARETQDRDFMALVKAKTTERKAALTPATEGEPA